MGFHASTIPSSSSRPWVALHCLEDDAQAVLDVGEVHFSVHQHDPLSRWRIPVMERSASSNRGRDGEGEPALPDAARGVEHGEAAFEQPITEDRFAGQGGRVVAQTTGQAGSCDIARPL